MGRVGGTTPPLTKLLRRCLALIRIEALLNTSIAGLCIDTVSCSYIYELLSKEAFKLLDTKTNHILYVVKIALYSSIKQPRSRRGVICNEVRRSSLKETQ